MNNIIIFYLILIISIFFLICSNPIKVEQNIATGYIGSILLSEITITIISTLIVIGYAMVSKYLAESFLIDVSLAQSLKYSSIRCHFKLCINKWIPLKQSSTIFQSSLFVQKRSNVWQHISAIFLFDFTTCSRIGGLHDEVLRRLGMCCNLIGRSYRAATTFQNEFPELSLASKSKLLHADLAVRFDI